MKLHTLFLTTHTAVAATTAALVIVAFQSGTATATACAWALSLIALAAAAWFTSGRVRAGLSALESVVSDHETSRSLVTGLSEFDESSKRIGQVAARWESVAANTRQQAREFQSMITMLNRRGATGEPSSDQLRDLLAGLGSTLHSQLQQIERGAAEIEQHTQTITDGAEEQRHVVIKTTAHVEQLSATIESVSNNANSAGTAVEQTNQSASEAEDLVRGLIDGLAAILRSITELREEAERIERSVTRDHCDRRNDQRHCSSDRFVSSQCIDRIDSSRRARSWICDRRR